MRRRPSLARVIALFVTVAALASSPSSSATAQEAKAPAKRQVPIAVLAYHRFDPQRPGSTTITTPVFESELRWLAAHHYKIVPLQAVVDGLRGKGPPITGHAVAITADDGHRSVYTYLFPIIKREHVPVTLFIYPSAISHARYALTWGEIKTMLASGLVSVQSHTYWHPNFRKERARRSPADYRAFVDFQLRRSKAVLEKRLGIKVTMLAWPYGIFDKDLEAAAAKAGYIAAFAYAGGAARPGDDLLALPRVPVSNAARGARFGALVDASSHVKARP